MILSKATLPDIAASTVQKPAKELLNLPEKVLQFGTGVLLRGLPDFFIDKANKQGVFNGRVVVVKSTDSGGADAFDKQDGLYTICVQGIDKGKKVEENIIAGAISRVLSVRQHWKDILQTAYNHFFQYYRSGHYIVRRRYSPAAPGFVPGKVAGVFIRAL